jgi:hypothetical protein
MVHASCPETSAKIANSSQIIIIMSFDNQSIVPASARGRALRICILDVAAQHTLDRTVTTSPPADDEQHNSDDVCGASHKYPHDAHAVLRCMYPDATIDIVELKPDARRSIAELRRLDRKKYDLFVNLYDLSDDTGQKIVEFMEHRSIPFTGAGGRFYDPTRELLKMHCRYAGLDTPMFMLIDDAALLDSDDEAVRIVEELGGFPLFIKPGSFPICFFFVLFEIQFLDKNIRFRAWIRLGRDRSEFGGSFSLRVSCTRCHRHRPLGLCVG